MKKVLIIEDEDIFREQLVELLGFEGFVAIGVGDGGIGITTVLREQPDIILSDITMPSVDGYEVLKMVRTNTTTADTPFIFMSARTTQTDIEKGLLLGADAYLTKPFRLQELLQTMQGIMI